MYLDTKSLFGYLTYMQRAFSGRCPATKSLARNLLDEAHLLIVSTSLLNLPLWSICSLSASVEARSLFKVIVNNYFEWSQQLFSFWMDWRWDSCCLKPLSVISCFLCGAELIRSWKMMEAGRGCLNNNASSLTWLGKNGNQVGERKEKWLVKWWTFFSETSLAEANVEQLRNLLWKAST